MLRYAQIGKGTLELTKLKFESYGDPDCDHEIRSSIEASGDRYFYVWKCKKCGLEAYQFLGVREYSYKDVIQEAREYWLRK